MVDIKLITENIYLIDDHLYSIPKWGSVYLVNEEKKALVDTGPTTSAKAVLGGIKKAGVNPEDIDYLIVTHVHLDHAGGAGTLLKEMPKAQVVVHHRGARHLVNPERLVSSVAAAQGEAMMAKLGEVVPVPVERVKPVNDGDVIELGNNQVLKFIDAPGHAPHELCVHESRNNGLFSGDAVGISMADNKVLLPVTPPPSFDLEAYLGTLDRLLALKVSTIYYAHFGASDKVQEDLRLAKSKLEAWDDLVGKAVAGDGFGFAAEKFKDRLYAELEPARNEVLLYRYLVGGMVPLNIAGYLQYYREKHNVN